MVTPVCVLRSGPEYSARHVQALAKQVPGLVALTDAAVPGVTTVPLRYDFPGWWAKLELFSGSISGDLLYFDLDTVVLGDIAPLLAAGRTTVLRDFYHPSTMGSGLMYIAEADKAEPWANFVKDPGRIISTHKRFPLWGDQGFLNGYIGRSQKWQDIIPGQVVSYKRDCRKGLPPGARVVCFHGKPRPWDISAAWIPKLP